MKKEISRFAVDGSKLIWSQCNKCKHRQAYLLDVKTTRCNAFADIPNTILRNQHDHTKPYPGDNGILFEAVDHEPTKRN